MITKAKIRFFMISMAVLFILGRYSGFAAAPEQELDKKTIVEKSMNLTPEQEQKFWPLYDEYQILNNQLNADRMAVLKKFSINYNDMTNDLAKELLDQTMDIEKKRLNLKKGLITKFSRILPARLVARYFQIESKLDIMVMAAGAEKIPLVK